MYLSTAFSNDAVTSSTALSVSASSATWLYNNSYNKLLSTYANSLHVYSVTITINLSHGVRIYMDKCMCAYTYMHLEVGILVFTNTDYILSKIYR